MKRPSFQFYPADWRKDMALQSCSVSARGLWIDMMCIAHECEPYGHLTVNGKPMTPAQIGRHTGLTERECSKLITELKDAGVASVNDQGVMFSRRMVRDEEARETRAEIGRANGAKGAEHGKKGADYGGLGGRPKKATNPDENRGEEPGQKPPQNPLPSSSSSSSSSNTPKPPRGQGGSVHDFPQGFDRLWEAYPRKIGKDAAAKAFAKRRPDDALLARMLAAVAKQTQSDQWRKDGGQYIPHLATWLNQGRWEDEVDHVGHASEAGSLWEGAL